MNPAKRHEFFARLQAANPAPTTELNWSTPFELLVAVILSAQATDKGVNLATAKLFPVANTPQAILALGLDGLKDHVKTIGLYNSKAKNVIATCEALVAQHGGEVPRDREALEALPGVGRKTANVVLNTVFGEPTMAVDTHIFRVSNRTGLAPGRNVREVEDRLLTVVPQEFLLNAHHWLILHGRYVCKARTPECWRCVVHDLCAYRPKTPDPKAAAVPAPRPKAPRPQAPRATASVRAAPEKTSRVRSSDTRASGVKDAGPNDAGAKGAGAKGAGAKGAGAKLASAVKRIVRRRRKTQA